MMTAKTRGNGLVVPFDESDRERPSEAEIRRDDVRSIAHLKMLQSLSGKLSRLNDVAQIGLTISDELRLLVDYHNCRVFLREEDDLVPVAFRGDLTGLTASDPVKLLPTSVGRGITGRVAETGVSLLVGDAARHEFGEQIAGTAEIEESLLAVPLRYGARVTGVIVISKLGLDQFDADDLRLLEVMAGHASVALENARLYEAQRREAESAKALLALSRDLAEAGGTVDVAERVGDGRREHPREPGHVRLAPGGVRRRLCRLALSPEPAGRRSDADPRRVPRAVARRRSRSPSALGLCGDRGGARGNRGSVRDRPLRRRWSLGRRRGRDRRQVEPRRPRARAPREHRAPDPTRPPDRGELREPRAHLPLDRGGARECARGQRRVHVDPRALDHRPRAAGRRASSGWRRTS